MHEVAEQEGVERIRFLTSHPNWMTDELLDTVAELPRVMPQIEVPVQAGDDEVLARMRRGYTVAQYRALVQRIRERIPDVAIHCDIIVGFPGETAEQFQGTYDLLEELKLDKVHLARYSRARTPSACARWKTTCRTRKSAVTPRLSSCRRGSSRRSTSRFLGKTVEVLVEDQHRGKWRGRTPQNKLVFFEDDSQDWRGKLAQVTVTWTGPWSMQGRLAARAQPADGIIPIIAASDSPAYQQRNLTPSPSPQAERGDYCWQVPRE